MAQIMHPAEESVKILERRKTVQSMWLRGCLQWEIASDLNISRRTVCRDLAVIMAIGRERLIGDRQEEWLWEEIGKLNRWEKEANDEWERSKLDAQIRTAKMVKSPDDREDDGTVIPGGIRSETIKREEGQCGDPRYLTEARGCAMQRCKLLGLIVDKVAPTMPDGQSAYPPLEALVAALAREDVPHGDDRA